ncbi:MAG: cysteine-rich CWC family protein [Chitinophagales bacterium]|nr:cysteine-rich CWC family protein [Chitinophagaceae bacterium]MCB9066060.1 cysteine-rich CWC family protein [Chitinophagales bacterium]
MEEKHCSNCKKSFGCLADERGCWCEQHHLSAEKLQYLKENFDNCLCPDCLKKVEEGTGEVIPREI